jgi:cytochrome c-type biogenesis protein CcmE
MLSRKRKRINLILIGLVLLIFSAALVGYGMREGIEFFKSPSEILDTPPVSTKRFRLGGLVSENSVIILDNGSVSFEVTDNIASIEVRFDGVLPDLFAENQGVIASGFLKDKSVFYADEVLAKHDENYMPKEILDTLKEKGIFVDPSIN